MANQPKLATVCSECGNEERKLIHNVSFRGNFRRLCTTCVLSLNPKLFCPTCLGVYERSPPENAVVCFKCYSYSHPRCVTLSPRGPSPCWSCLNPNSLKFTLNRVENGSRVINHNAARLLLAAGNIAFSSMSKAEVAAAMEAEKRSKEAAYTKKRAQEALDHVVKLMGKEKINNVSESKNKGKVDQSSEVLEALNAVELKESGRQVQGVFVESVVPKLLGNGVVGMDVDVGHGKDLGVNLIAENGSVKSDDLMKVVVEGENTCNGHEHGFGKG